MFWKQMDGCLSSKNQLNHNCRIKIWVFVLGFASFFFTAFQKTEAAQTGVAVVEIKGPIFDSTEIVEQLQRVYDNDDLKALILRIDSPGGAVSPSQDIYQAVLKVKEKKRVVASFGSVAASGAYYIAVAADKIVANPGSITGSIGVLMEYTNVEELLKFLKVHSEILKAGERKDIGSAIRPMTPEERTFLQGILDNMHQQFKSAVRKGRSLTQEEIDKLADGRIFTGEQALQLKLVDQLGSQQTAIELVQQMLQLSQPPRLFYPKKKRVSLLDLFAEENIENRLLHMFYSLRGGRVLYWTQGASL